MRELLRHVIDGLERGRERVVCQVVETRGSTPQKAGALMVVDAEAVGGQVGTLGGGCVEAEVKKKAVRRAGCPGAVLESFVLDHDYAWADGLICGGKMVVCVEALRGAGPLGYYRAYQALLEAGDGFTEAVVVDPARPGLSELPAGARFVFGPSGECVAGWPVGRAPVGLADRVAPLVDRPKPGCRGGLALIPTLPRVRLVIVGAGHVGQGVAALAAQADFDVWVVDDRAQYANAERFPAAKRHVVGPVDEVLPALEMNANTYALIVTRGHGHDQEALYHLAPTRAGYVGLIGSARKIRMIFESLGDLGVPADALARVSAPVGLDIGSQTVPEIAVSIVAELIARRNLGPSGVKPKSAGSSLRATGTGTQPEPEPEPEPAASPARG